MNGSDDYDRAKHAEPAIDPIRTVRRWAGGLSSKRVRDDGRSRNGLPVGVGFVDRIGDRRGEGGKLFVAAAGRGCGQEFGQLFPALAELGGLPPVGWSTMDHEVRRRVPLGPCSRVLADRGRHRGDDCGYLASC